tara:strand:- start:11 stop:1291 length:1281 start_codon:yes stop_codon:yes gene_type:complete
MGIDNVAIKTFNSTGSQSVCRANEADETKLIESEFLTKCATEYINGSGTSFIAGSIDLTKLKGSKPHETFTLPSDVDAISEITLQMSLGASGTNVSQTFILDLISKIEIKLGNLVVQTILPGDIYARNLTESGYVVSVNTYQSASSGIYGTAANVDFALSIPFTGRSTGVNKSFLQAGAVTNNLTMKVYYNSLGSSGVAGLAATHPASVSTGVCVFSHSMTSTEKNFIAKNIINRPVNTSQSVAYSLSSITSSSAPVTIDLSSININVSHILLTLDNSIFNSTGTAAALSSGSGGTTWTAIPSGIVENTELGVAAGWLKSAELILGNDRTGSVPGSCLTTNKLELFKLTSVASKNIYILKLAGSAFSTAGVPFSRLNNKKLVITYADGFTLSSYTDSTTTGMTNINVTCCGTQIQSTVGGTISFSA